MAASNLRPSEIEPQPIAAAVPLQGYSIEAESESFDTDSAVGDDDSLSLTTSISSSVIDYVYENGRRYHSYREGEYLFPNDEDEQDRLDMVHHIFRLMLGGSLYKAPVSNSPQRILDIGTGTGIYAMQIADEFPCSDVLGIDLSPIQPEWYHVDFVLGCSWHKTDYTTCRVSPNCRFIVDDIEAEWPYPEDGAFDYIHQRNMVGSIADWDKLFQQAFKHTKPGGYIELQEFRVWFRSQDGELPEDSSIQLWQRALLDGTVSFGKPINIIEKLADKLKDAGFVGVQENVLKIPIGSWPKDRKLKEIGQYMQVHAMESVEPLTLALFTRVLGWSELECRVLIAKTREEFKTTRKQLYVYAHFIYGQKPDNQKKHGTHHS